MSRITKLAKRRIEEATKDLTNEQCKKLADILEWGDEWVLDYLYDTLLRQMHIDSLLFDAIRED